MRTKKGFNLRTVCGENIIVAEGKENIDFSNIISMNESSAYLWKEVTGREFTCEELAELLTREYNVEKETALKDVTALTEEWKKIGIIE
ncbi:PqqD family protein [Prevotella sp. PCHR]|uniref:PqqD family protein n=1 Tax=Xylanibacter caecicola TaxID=2736294 RepID=A0ABX2B591_9BACT|nr:PqqD family protein [Xylanibacter caecicola]NPE25567.1 PqqD family protein [Xylanibacter caecicola]